MGWAIYINRNPGGLQWSDFKGVERQQAMAYALNSEGLQLYHAKNDAYAIKKFEEAIEHYAYGELYFNYCNSLSNVPRLEDAIAAYKIALQLSYDHAELIYYNLACAYSRMKLAKEGFENLALAINRGYNAYQYIESDPDMQFLRSQSNWRLEIESLKPENIEINEKAVTGKITFPTERSPYFTVLCSTGIYINYSQGCTPGYSRGTWSLHNSDLMLTPTESCYAKGSGRSMAAATCSIFEKYEIQPCEVSTGKPEVTLEKNALQRLVKGTKKDMWAPEFAAGVIEPKQCNPNFQPGSLADFTVQ